MTRLVRLAMLSAASAFLLIVLGGAVHIQSAGEARLAGSGCGGDWPLCHGRLLPPAETAALIEYAHRLTAALVGVLALAVMIGVVRTGATSRRTRLSAAGAFALVAIQGAIGKATVGAEPPAVALSAHLGLGLLYFFTTLLIVYFLALDRDEATWLVNSSGTADRPFLGIAVAGATGITLMTASGEVVTSLGALAVGGISAVVLLAALLRQTSPAAWRLATIAASIATLHVTLSSGYLLDLDAWHSTAQRATATLVWAATVGVVLVSWPAARATVRRSVTGRTASPVAAQAAWTYGQAEQHGLAGSYAAPTLAFAAPGLALPTHEIRRAKEIAAAYLALMKPGILTLLLITTLGAMLIAAAELPSFGLILATLIGGTLAAGGANVLNCYIDRDIDALMHRTKKRGTVTGLVSPRGALIFGLTLSALAVIELGLLVNWVAAGLALAGNLYYVLIYTRLLKRRTPQNIVIGGAAGAMPPLVGWAAITGNVSIAAVLLFALIYYWTPPHFWSLALLKQGEYGRAAVPMLPVVAGEEETRRQILLYSILMAAVSLMLVPFGFSWLYVISAVVINGLFVGLAIDLYRRPSKRLARKVFFFSLWYLALIFGAMVLDRLLLA
ncbi:MAG TPA: heme o synthase [Thermomicrobiales bacterium]